MTSAIKAIETRYKGYRFRSRLEARWAVFFDALGLQWGYEPEGFELPGGIRYLPDFRLRVCRSATWCEIKPEHTPLDDKFSLFKTSLRQDADCTDGVVQLSGDPLFVVDAWIGSAPSYLGDFTSCFCPRCGNPNAWAAYCPRYCSSSSEGIVAVQCDPCDWSTGSQNDPEKGLAAGVVVQSWKGHVNVHREDWLRWEKALRLAGSQARSARFEHGESGGRA